MYPKQVSVCASVISIGCDKDERIGEEWNEGSDVDCDVKPFRQTQVLVLLDGEVNVADFGTSANGI
jgi:hypothetical protein